MAATETRVFVMLPDDSADPAHSTWSWIHCLTFPLDTLNKLQFTSKPYKWIRFATGVVIGAQGHLSFGRDSPQDVIEYNGELPSANTTLFYHISDDEKQKMFPIDPAIINPTTTSEASTSGREGFRDALITRDRECVLTRFEPMLCDGAYLLPHRKGDDYIETYTQRRSRDPDGKDIVRDIDDVRNGIFLNSIGHRCFGKQLAFIVTPNFAMTTADIDPTAPPTERRCTAHLFVPEKPEYFGDRALRSGAMVQMPDPADNWPPDILFDAIYARAVLAYFAPKTMVEKLDQWKNFFYREGITSAAQAEQAAREKEQAANDERKQEQKRARGQRRTDSESRAGDNHLDYFDYLMILPYIMVPPEKQLAIWRKDAEERAERQRSHLKDKVGSWAREVATGQ